MEAVSDWLDSLGVQAIPEDIWQAAPVHEIRKFYC